jgi:hypothetical protein
VAVDPDVAAADMPPSASNPDSVGAGRRGPAAGDPDVAGAVPAVIAADPNPATMRARARMFDDDRRRSNADDNALGEGRRQAEERGRGDKKQFLHKWVFLSQR